MTKTLAHTYGPILVLLVLFGVVYATTLDSQRMFIWDEAEYASDVQAGNVTFFSDQRFFTALIRSSLLQERLRLCIPGLVPVEVRQVVEHARQGGMRWP